MATTIKYRCAKCGEKYLKIPYYCDKCNHDEFIKERTRKK